MKKYIKIAVIIAVCLWFYKSGNLQKTIDYFAIDKPPVSDPASASLSGNDAKDSLLAVIEEQSRLADDINEARKNRDRDEMKRLFAEFEELENRYQDEFVLVNQNLTTSEGNEISREHRKVMLKLN